MNLFREDSWKGMVYTGTCRYIVRAHISPPQSRMWWVGVTTFIGRTKGGVTEANKNAGYKVNGQEVTYILYDFTYLYTCIHI